MLIVEANSELGSFCCTHETWAQTLDSPHVGVSFAGNSPVIEDLDLEQSRLPLQGQPRDPGHHLPRRHQLPDLPGAGADRRELRPALRRRRRADAGHPGAGPRDAGGVQRALLVHAAPGPLQAGPHLRDLRLRHGVQRGRDVGDERSGAVRAHLRVGRLPADPDDAGRVLGARGALRPRPGRLRGHLRALLHDRDRRGRQRDPGGRPDRVLSGSRGSDSHELHGRPDRGGGRPGHGRRARGALASARRRDRGPPRCALQRRRARDPAPGGRGHHRRRRPSPRGQDAPLEDGTARLARDVLAARPAHRLGLVRLRPADQRGHPGLPRVRLVGGHEALHGRHARQRHLEGRRAADGVHLLRAR